MVQAKTTNQQKAADPKYRVRKDGYEWIFRPRELIIKSMTNGDIAYRSCYPIDFYWVQNSCQEKITRSAQPILYGDQKRAQAIPSITSILVKVANNWHPPTAEEIKKQGQKKELSKLSGIHQVDLQTLLGVADRICVYHHELLEIILAVAISSQMNMQPPIWLMIIGAPSSSKTELVKLFDSLHDVFAYYVDALTENAFTSGYVPPDGSEPKDLLQLLDNKCLIVKDYTTLFSMREDTIKKILGDLTGIFDKDFSKFSATRGNVRYSSLFSQIGCVTPAIFNKHYRYMNQLGARFLYYKIPQLTKDELNKGFAIANSSNDREATIKAVKNIASACFTQTVDKLPATLKNFKEKDAVTQKMLQHLSVFLAKARSLVMTQQNAFKNDKGDNVSYHEIVDKQEEQPWRALQQLTHLAKALAIARGKDSISHQEIATVRNVAMNSMPIDRAKVLAIFKEKTDTTSKELSNNAGIDQRTAQKLLKELLELGILDMRADADEITGAHKGNRYFPVIEFEDILRNYNNIDVKGGTASNGPDHKNYDKITPEMLNSSPEKILF